MRLVRASHDTGAHLRRVLVRQLPEQVRGVRWRGHLGRVLLLRVHQTRKGQGWVSQDYKSG
ncbi:hypothetical protein SMACR_06473 [Sordaria macrospora]|uniref:Uncharacterized protein n=1 Tax=Sordaria macrospora TaxID=5147 RepID=A0A8S8ZQH7_SORMA|nr:hypothetical protein SMACR_06473 [Sordaria macrospora]